MKSIKKKHIKKKKTLPPESSKLKMLMSARNSLPTISETTGDILSLGAFPILGEIPAGMMFNGINPRERMEINQVILDGKRYRVLNLRTGERQITIPTSRDYFILKVVGNSMNASFPIPINNGDYVLLVQSNQMVTDGDIVVVEILGEDVRSTLKRIFFKHGKFFLIPESHDPNFQQPIDPIAELTKLDNYVVIQGIAKAVFKCVDNQ